MKHQSLTRNKASFNVSICIQIVWCEEKKTDENSVKYSRICANLALNWYVSEYPSSELRHNSYSFE